MNRPARNQAGVARAASGARTFTEEDRRVRDQLRRLAYVLDTAIPLPGGYRIGADGLIGLIPGFGDLAGTLISSYIITQAHRLGAPTSVLMRMASNILLETVVGVVPVVGDLFDFAWKANRRNVDLLEQHLASPGQTRRHSRLVVVAIIAGLIAAAAAVGWIFIALVHWVWTSLSAG